MGSEVPKARHCGQQPDEDGLLALTLDQTIRLDDATESEELLDKDLVLAFKRGDKGAYQAIYDRYKQRVSGICRKMLGRPEEAQEASQETFIRVYQALGRFNGRYQLGPWVTRIATNVCLDQIRARSRRPVETTLLELFESDARSPVESDPETLVIRNAESRRIRRALDELPPLHRAAIVLRDFEGLSYGEIGLVLGVTDAQVKALLHRARQRFKRSWPLDALSFIGLGRLTSRWRKFEFESAERTQPVAHSLTHGAEVLSSGAQFVSSCSTALQQCGQYLADKLAPTVVALSLGVVGTAVAGTQPKPAPREISQGLAVPTEEAVAKTVTSGISNSSPAKKAAPAQQPSTSEGDPSAPEASPAPAPVPPEGEVPAEEPVPEASPTVAPEPQGFALDFSAGGPVGAPCECLAQTDVGYEDLQVSDETGIESFEQVVAGSANAGGVASYGLSLEHRTTANSRYEADFVLSTEEGAYRYAVSGALVDRVRTAWGGWVYSYEGTYAIYSRPTMSEPVPEHGSFSIELTASWRQQRFVEVKVLLTEDQ